MQTGGSELCDGQTDLTRTPEGANFQTDPWQLVAKSETSASPVQNFLVDEAQPTTLTRMPRQCIYWLPIHKKNLMRCYFEIKKKEIPHLEKATPSWSRIVPRYPEITITMVTGRDLIQRKRTIQQNNLLSSRQITQIRSEVDAALQEHGEEVL